VNCSGHIIWHGDAAIAAHLLLFGMDWRAELRRPGKRRRARYQQNRKRAVYKVRQILQHLGVLMSVFEYGMPCESL
jgi:hypothetical protein